MWSENVVLKIAFGAQCAGKPVHTQRVALFCAAKLPRFGLQGLWSVAASQRCLNAGVAWVAWVAWVAARLRKMITHLIVALHLCRPVGYMGIG